MWSKYFVLEKEAIINKVCVLCMPLFTSKTPRHLIFPSAPSDAAGQRRTAPFSPSRKRRLVSRKKGEGKNIMHIKGSEESNAPAKRRGKGKEGGGANRRRFCRRYPPYSTLCLLSSPKHYRLLKSLGYLFGKKDWGIIFVRFLTTLRAMYKRTVLPFPPLFSPRGWGWVGGGSL